MTRRKDAAGELERRRFIRPEAVLADPDVTETYPHPYLLLIDKEPLSGMVPDSYADFLEALARLEARGWALHGLSTRNAQLCALLRREGQTGRGLLDQETLP